MTFVGQLQIYEYYARKARTLPHNLQWIVGQRHANCGAKAMLLPRKVAPYSAQLLALMKSTISRM